MSENTATNPAAPEPVVENNGAGGQPADAGAGEKPSTLPISGTILNGADSKPLVDAVVFAAGTGDADPVTASNVTGADGRFELQLAPGDWNIVAWHPDYTATTQLLPLKNPISDLQLRLALGKPGFKVAGRVVWQGTTRGVPDILVNATSVSASGAGVETKYAETDNQGNYAFDALLKPGQWTIAVAQQGELYGDLPTRVTLVRDRNNLNLSVLRRMSAADKRAGKLCFAALCIGLLLLAVLYIGLHQIAPPTSELARVMQSQVDQAADQIEQLRAQNSVTSTSALSTTVGEMQRTWSVISDTSPVLSGADREQIGQIMTTIEDVVQQNQFDAATAHLDTLRQLAASLNQDYFWRQEPFRYLEVLMWGLAGVLVNLIMKTGSYLRWGRFYIEGIYLHIAQLVTVPLLALVFVFLLSNVQLTINITSTGDVSLALTDPRILAAVSFLIGAGPWAIWGFIQDTAARITGQAQGA